MSAAQQLKPVPARDDSHLHTAGEFCPTCEQPIPDDRFDEIKERIETRQQEQSAAITSRLKEQFARDKTIILEQAQQETRTAIEQERQLAAEKIVLARDEGRQVAEAAAQEQIAAAKRAGEEALTTLQTRIEETEAAKANAEAAGALLRSQLETAQRENAATIERIKEEAAAKEQIIRGEAKLAAEAAMETKLAELEQARLASEASFQERIAAAEQAGAIIQAQLEELKRENTEAINRIKEEALAKEGDIRKEAASAALAQVQTKITETEQARAEAEAKAAAAEEQARTLAASHEEQLTQRLTEQREAMERAHAEALNVEKSAVFEEKLKLSNKVEELQRALDKKTAEELGEGAEIDLFEALKSEFEGDRIERVNRGQPGADILHCVIHNGKECGKIIYDSKNHNAWRNDFVIKLSADQMAAKAEHAILSTRKFPARARHLHVQDGIILASPARVVALVTIVRQHLIQTQTLRLSNEERTQKTAELYSFITSERCADLFTRIDTHAEDMLDLQVKEKKAHEAHWKREGELLRSVQKVRAEICTEIGAIIGTVEAVEKLNES
jgi:hypothetical protein